MIFQHRLQTVMQRGNLTVADLARWFGRPDATVRSWVANGHQPSGGPHDRIMVEQMLTILERFIKKRQPPFPIPPGTPTRWRKTAIAKSARSASIHLRNP